MLIQGWAKLGPAKAEAKRAHAVGPIERADSVGTARKRAFAHPTKAPLIPLPRVSDKSLPWNAYEITAGPKRRRTLCDSLLVELAAN